MRYCTLIGSSILSAALFIGCDSKKDETPVTPPPVPTAATPSATPADAVANADKAAGAAADTANKTAADTANKATADANATAAPAMNAVGNADATTEAQGMIQKVMQYIKDKKFDDADTLMKKLQGMKASLPESIQKQIDNAQTALTGAKAANSVKMPDGIPAMGK